MAKKRAGDAGFWYMAHSMSAYFLLALSTLLTTVNPIESLAPFLSLTEGQTPEERVGTARRATLVSGAILLATMACGAVIFRVFGISLPAFRIAGGILLFSVGVGMLNPRPQPEPEAKPAQGRQGEDVAIFPLAIPLVAGPGAIASSLILSERASGAEELVGLYVALFLTQAILYVVFSKAERISRLLGPAVLQVVNRLMGLILAALAVQFVLDGARDALPGLAS